MRSAVGNLTQIAEGMSDFLMTRVKWALRDPPALSTRREWY